MEFLNNIWNAISTQNQGLINIIMILATFIEAYLLTFLFICIANFKPTNKQKLSYILLITFVSIITMFFIPNPYNIFINYSIMFIVIHKIFKINFLKTFIMMSSSILIFALLGSLILNPYLSILKITYENLITIPIYRISYLCILYISALIICLVLKFTRFSLNLLEDYDKKN